MKTLLLNASYETIGFISFRKLVKLLAKNKIEVIAEWSDQHIRWTSGSIRHPATVRMKYYVRSVQRKLRFNKRGVFKRDLYVCQYCNILLTNDQATLDHVIPQAKGGSSTWENCATSCRPCNAKKANRTPEEAGLVLLNKPHVPKKNMIYSEYHSLEPKHSSWKDYFE